MVRTMRIETVAEVLRALDAYGLEPIVFGGWSVDGCVGVQRRHHSDLDMLVPVEDFAKCVHILTHEIGYTWKNNACFLTGCQKAELVSEGNDLVEVFGYVQKEGRVRFEGLLFAVATSLDAVYLPRKISIKGVSFRVFQPDVVRVMTTKLSQIQEDKETVGTWTTEESVLCLTERRTYAGSRQAMLSGGD
jgi:hypothetical protein